MKRPSKPDVPFVFIWVSDRKVGKTDASRLQFLDAAYKSLGGEHNSKPVEVILVCKLARQTFWGGDQEICDYLHRGAFAPPEKMRLYEVELPD